MGGLLAKTKFEQRKPFYKDVEDLITVGFLTHPVRIHDTRISLRSLCPGDLTLLRIRSEGLVSYEWQQWVVASSIWMIDGFNLLEEPHAVPRIYRSLDYLPPLGKEILFHLVLGLFARQGQAFDATEIFCYETHSRYLWKGLQGSPLENNGIPGSSRLGTNAAQQMWSIFNQAEDLRQEDEARWNGFKLVASAMSPKGIKKLDQKDSQNKLNEKERRQAALDRFFYIQTGVIKPPKKGEVSSDSSVVPGPKSTEELEDEMHRWVTGQDDFHDQVVKNYKRRIAQRYMQEKEEREARAEMLRQRIETQEGEQPLVGYTEGQMKDMLKDRKPGAPGVKWVPGGQQASRDYLYERYLDKEPDSGLLRPGPDGSLQEMDQGDLMRRVSQRSVPFQSEPKE